MCRSKPGESGRGGSLGLGAGVGPALFDVQLGPCACPFRTQGDGANWRSLFPFSISQFPLPFSLTRGHIVLDGLVEDETCVSGGSQHVPWFYRAPQAGLPFHTLRVSNVVCGFHMCKGDRCRTLVVGCIYPPIAVLGSFGNCVPHCVPPLWCSLT